MFPPVFGTLAATAVTQRPLSVLMSALLFAALTFPPLSEDVDVVESLVSVDEVDLLESVDWDESV